MTAYWFKPKSHGYGATPTCWQGWAAVGAFAVACAGLSWLILGWAADVNGALDPGLVVVWLVMLAALTSAFVLLTKAKTEGEWRWRWGEGEHK